MATYVLSSFLRKGNICCNCSNSDKPCTNVTGGKNKNMKTIDAIRMAIRRIQSCSYGIQRLDQYTSRDSGAKSVTHNIGFDV